MNEEFKAFQKLLGSTEELLAGDYSYLDSVEIRGSAEKVNRSLQPCLQQLKVYINQFQPFIKACFDELDRAEDVWNSKQRIIDFPTLTIWEKLGEIAGLDTQIQTIGQECKRVALEEARSLVSDMISRIKKGYFYDFKNRKEKIDLGWGDKDNFNKNISGHIKSYSDSIEKVIDNNFKKILLKYSYSLLNSEIIFSHMSVLDKDSYLKFKQDYDKINTSLQESVTNTDNAKNPMNQKIFDRVKKIVAAGLEVAENSVTPGARFANDLGADSLDAVELVMELEEEFDIEIPDEAAEQIDTVSKAVDYISLLIGDFPENTVTIGIFVIAMTDIANWKKKSGNITWKEVESFGTSFKKSVENKIERFFDHRMNFPKHSLQLLLKNYNDLLEKQSRYRQEKPEQRLAEKAWIDRQRQSLQEIQARLDEILK